ncbi:MAG: protein-disulfide reductase DsbD [Pseudomonadota bacterium]
MHHAFMHRFVAPLFGMLGLLAMTTPPALAEEEDLLEPEKAFRFSAQSSAPGKVEARFQIANGYYLYHSKIKFSADNGVKLGEAAIPPGKVKQDEFMGKVETHRGDLRVQIPVTGKADKFNLKAEFQGCADVGVCYPPQDATVAIRMMPASTAAAAVPAAATPAAPLAQSTEALARLKSLAPSFGEEEPEFLSPEEAFQVQVVARTDGNLEARFTVAQDYYLYRDKIHFKVLDPAGVTVSSMDLPPADEKDDPNFGKTYVYHAPFSVTLKLAGLPADAKSLKLMAEHQGCSEKGICYPPQETELVVDLTAPVAGTDAAPATSDSQPAAAEDSSETGQIARILQGGNFWVIIASFFGFGLLLSLTPCVFPMIPILSGIIVGRGTGMTKAKGFSLSLAYVLGMALTYAIIGIIAGLSGTLISNALQNPWALSIGAGIFVALALSMFGFYELQMPSFLQSRLTEASNKVPGGRFGGVFAMGALSALIVGPCVAAPLAGALLYISQTGDVVLGGVSLFSLAMGMGVPLLLVGLSAGALLPKAGGWMEAVKKFFGVALLAVAIWLISPLLSPVVHMGLWAALLVISAMYLHAMDPLPANAHGFARFWKGVGVLFLVAGISLLLGALGGSRDVLQPLSVFQGGSGGVAQAATAKLDFKKVKNVAELEAAVAAAGKPVMLDFYADWCVSCKEMERFTFSDPKVHERLKDVVLLKADVTGNTADDKALLARFKLFGPPGIIFFDASGKEVAYRVVGYEKTEQFLTSIDKAIP